MKKSELRQIIKEEIKKSLQESTAKILEPEFGSDNDSEFLKVVWYLPIEELELLLKTSLQDLMWLKKNSKGLLRGFNRRDAKIVRNRIEFIKQIINSKKKIPDYIPDIHKKSDTIQESNDLYLKNKLRKLRSIKQDLLTLLKQKDLL